MTQSDTAPKKSLGQHWLSDKSSLEAICRAAEISPGDQVLEIGPGTGELTTVLIEFGALVTALEFDQELIEPLRQKFNHQIKLVQGDIRKFDLTKLPAGYKIVANIPYYLSAYLLRLLAETINQPSVVSLLVQKEVAERVTAKPGQMSSISVAVQSNYEVSLGQVVPARLFTPPPKVDSQVLILSARQQPLFSEIDQDLLLKLAKKGFANRRKTLVNNLTNSTGLNRDQLETALTATELSMTVRAQELSLNDWYRLYSQLDKIAKNT